MKEKIIKKALVLHKKERLTFEKYNRTSEKFSNVQKKLKYARKQAYEAGEKFVDFLCENNLTINDLKKFYK